MKIFKMFCLWAVALLMVASSTRAQGSATYKLLISGTAKPLAGVCTPYTVDRFFVVSGKPAPAANDRTLTLTGNKAGGFYDPSDSTCSGASVLSVVLPSGFSTTRFHFKDKVVQSTTLSAADSAIAGGTTPGTLAISVIPAPSPTPSPLPSPTPNPSPTPGSSPFMSFLTSPQTNTVGHCSSALTIETYDANGRPLIQTKPLTTTLTVDVNVIDKTKIPVAYADAACTNVLPIKGGNILAPGSHVAGVTSILAGQSKVTIYFRGVASVNAFLPFYAQAPGYAYGTQNEIILPGPPVNFWIIGQDTLGTNSCSGAFKIAPVDSGLAETLVPQNTAIHLSGLGNSQVFSDPNCSIAVPANTITLPKNPIIQPGQVYPVSSMKFFVKDALSENLGITGAATPSLPFNFGVNLWVTSLANSGQPIPPQLHVLVPPRPAVPNVITVPPGGSINNALATAKPGDIIVLQAGGTYSEFTLPSISNPNGKYITIVSSGVAKLPAQGKRVSMADAPNMAKIVTTKSTGAINTLLASGSNPSSSYYRLIGLEVTIDPALSVNYRVVEMAGAGSGLVKATKPSDYPNHILLESSYVHGSSTQDVYHCVDIGGVNVGVVDSYISDCHVVGQDAQGIVGNGPGPYLIENNYIEGSTENVIFGGTATDFANEVVSDVTILHNTMQKQLSWNLHDPANFKCVMRGGQCQHWAVKNILEFKNARRALVDGNQFIYHWVDGQSGAALLITPRANGRDPFVVVEDIVYTNNVLAHSPSGFNILQFDYHGPTYSQNTTRVKIENNVFYDIGNDPIWGGAGAANKLFSVGADNLTINHNTVGFSEQTILAAIGTYQGFTFTNNIANCVGAPSPMALNGGTLDSQGAIVFPGSTITGNVFPGCPTVGFTKYLSTNYLPTSVSAIGFTKFTPDSQFNDTNILSLTTSSPYYHLLPPSDPVGQDLGVNWSTLQLHIQ